MEMKAKKRSFAQCSAGILGSLGACLLLLPWRDRTHGAPCLAAPGWSRIDLPGPDSLYMKDLCEQVFCVWTSLPSKTKIYFLKTKVPLYRGPSSLMHCYCTSPSTWPGPWLARRFIDELVRACRHALGNDVIVEMVGSLRRDTASPFASDIDLQVRRCRDRADVLFTETDKRKVARNLELIGVGPVTIGNVAIKFKLGDFPVDLVLMNPRWEDFPNLRGGENFYENSARIHECFNQMPVARSVILGIKHLFWDKRPKGILLEAIVWRLSTTFIGRLSISFKGRLSINFAGRLSESPIFSDLQVGSDDDLSYAFVNFLRYVVYVGISHIFFFRLCECLASVLKVASLVPAPLHSQSHRFPWSCPQSDLRLKSIQMMLPYHI